MKGLTISIIFEASSLNYGEGLGNVTSLKKITREDGENYSYISRQAIRYNIVEQMGINNTKLALDGTVVQFAPEATIKDYPEIDLFGYMKTSKEKSDKKNKDDKKEKTKTRSAVVRLSNGISIEPFSGDLDFLTNKALFDRYIKQTNDDKSGGNIAQSEIHKSYYTYTIAIDLDKVGVDLNDNIEIPNEEKAERIKLLLNTVKFLYRDIKGRREDLKPLFVIGGIYSMKNPFFDGKLKVNKNKVNVTLIKNILNLDKEIMDNTKVGFIRGIFSNDDEIEEHLKAVEMAYFFEEIKEIVDEYYK